jgi:cellulose synthase/poly-beta-1,6-N-acetylglucosamine synthase-like glycosyltransferase
VLTAILFLLLQTLGMVVFFNRYIAGIAVKFLRKDVFQDADYTLQPTVTVVVPMFNEGAGIRRTLESLLALDYAAGRLDITVVDDCSTDDSYRHAQDIARRSNGRVRVLRNAKNMGKRRSINRAVLASTAEIIVSVDSDVVVDRAAIRHMVARFTRPEIAAVGGKIDIGNKHDNWLTKMQAIKYFYGYHSLKNLEWSFQRILCLSGCLTAYRRSVLLELHSTLENRSFCGVQIKYGEDRFLTRQIIKAGYLTTMTLDAVCWTHAPTRIQDYLSQQLRWRRSNIVDYVGGLSHIWRLNPVIAVHYFSLCGLLLAYPALLMSAIVHGTLFSMIVRQVVIAAVLGLVYYWKAGKLPMERVHPLAFVPMALVVPVIYALMTPLALFTLDSGSWETRGHDDVEPEAVPVDGVVEPGSVVASAPVAVTAAASAAVSVAAAATQVANATGRFELPAA